MDILYGQNAFSYSTGHHFVNEEQPQRYNLVGYDYTYIHRLQHIEFELISMRHAQLFIDFIELLRSRNCKLQTLMLKIPDVMIKEYDAHWCNEVVASLAKLPISKRMRVVRDRYGYRPRRADSGNEMLVQKIRDSKGWMCDEQPWRVESGPEHCLRFWTLMPIKGEELAKEA